MTRRLAVLACRLLLGATFITSGWAKAVDPDGVALKLAEYAAAMGIPATWQALTLTAAVALATLEFVLGTMLLLGCYRRAAPILCLAVMAFMLPLTAWVWLADPVADCGCFGDLWVLSNGATFAKNVVLTVLAVVLAIWNRAVTPAVVPALQWGAATACAAYSLVVAYMGIVYQPLVDFRPWPAGTLLVSAQDEADSEPRFTYVDTFTGQRRDFSADSLPTDPRWEFEDRQDITDTQAADDRQFAITDPQDGSDITADVIPSEGKAMLVVVPDVDRVGLSRAHLIHGFGRIMPTVVLYGDGDSNGQWRTRTMAGLDVYHVDGSMLRRMARGDVALVMVRDGRVAAKLNAGALPTDYLDDPVPLARLVPWVHGQAWMWSLSIALVAVLGVLALLPRAVSRRKALTLHTHKSHQHSANPE